MSLLTQKKYSEMIYNISKAENLMTHAENSVKAGLMVGAATAVGTFLLGKPGAVLGSMLGLAGTLHVMEGKLVPLTAVLDKLRENEWLALISELKVFLVKAGMDLARLFATHDASFATVAPLVVTFIIQYFMDHRNIVVQQSAISDFQKLDNFI